MGSYNHVKWGIVDGRIFTSGGLTTGRGGGAWFIIKGATPSSFFVCADDDSEAQFDFLYVMTCERGQGHVRFVLNMTGFVLK